MTRQFFGQPNGEKWDYPDRGIGYRHALVPDRATGKWKQVYQPVEFHYVWEVAYLISAAGKPMGEANVRKLIRQGKLCGVKWNSVIEDFVTGAAARGLSDSTIPWQISVEDLRQFFEANGLVDVGRAERSQVPAGVAPGPVVAPVRAERDENVQRQPFTMSEAVDIGARLEPLEREAAKARQLSGRPSEKFTEGGEALAKVASALGMSRPTMAPVRAERPKVRWGCWDSCMVVIIVLCVIVLIVGAFVVVIILWKGL